MSSEILESTESNSPVISTGQAVGPKRVTFEEYLTLGEDTDRIEWIDGEVIRMAPAAERHQELVLFLLHTVGLYVEMNKLGRVISAPFAMKLDSQRRGREPDVLFIRTDRMHIIKTNHLDGPADLTVEIISPESVGRDRGEKFAEYEQAGIPEYWLIDPLRQQAEFFELGIDNVYHLSATPDGVFRSRLLPGFFLRTSWLWQIPAPTIEALRELSLLG